MSIRDLSLAPGQFEGLVADVCRMGFTREESEDAVSDAWITVAEKADQLDDGPIGGYLKGTARFKALKTRERRRRQGVSLDAIVDGDREHEGRGDSLEALVDHRVSAEPVEIIDLKADPITALRLALVKQGVSDEITPRGINRSKGTYTDEQVARVRELHAEGGRSQREIAELTGVKECSVQSYVTRKSRLTPTMEGWTKAMVEGAMRKHYRKHGQAPSELDCSHNPALPGKNVVYRLYGSYRTGILAAGLQMRSGGSEEVWTEDRIFEALCSWWHREKRPPNADELRHTRVHGLPSLATLKRKLGTTSSTRLMQMAFEHCAQTGCVRCATTEGSK
jgi:DNA-directed RNA polymerase specialized sigma24 family protein